MEKDEAQSAIPFLTATKPAAPKEHTKLKRATRLTTGGHF